MKTFRLALLTTIATSNSCRPVLTAQALAACLAAGACGGQVLAVPDSDLGAKAAEAAEIWAEETGIPIVTVVLPESGPRLYDYVQAVRAGSLGENVCGRTDKMTAQLTVINIDLDCVQTHAFTVRDATMHEEGHWLGAHHLPPDRVGIMAPHAYADPGDHLPSPSDLALICEVNACERR